jgi:dihydroxyacetone kinase phosphotransfer subunit
VADSSIVIVSHSVLLGDGLAELLNQLARGQVHIASASGVDCTLGTDATRIMSALRQCPADGPIYLFFDIGSSLMNCQMALDLIDESVRSRVYLVDAPLVEGAVAATVAASAGMPPDQVLHSAALARTTPKILA